MNEEITIPKAWLKGLFRYATDLNQRTIIAERRERTITLIGYIFSAEELLKEKLK